MRKEMCRNRVSGFLDVQGRKIVNEAGDEVLLAGWGLGNWLLCEGYMWLSDGAERFDRPRRIEAVIEQLTGKTYADQFWKRFRENYITEDDIGLMAQMGYNSVRIPINARLFVQEGPGIHFLEEGFSLLARVVDWCEKYRLYAFLDLHGAPGGQTGTNIDDSIDDQCRLFIDQDQFDKGLALWEELAKRYSNRWIVGGYDLLNEPIRPTYEEEENNLDKYLPRLVEFYERCIERIRLHDFRHIISLEGHHWATSQEVFTHVYDSKMIIHFHRYGCTPDIEAFRSYLELSERLNVPLWLGETGENTMEWFCAMTNLCAELGVGFNMWPWKKMKCDNSPCSVQPPRDWEMIIDYAKGGRHPGYDKAQEILEEYLQNMKLKNCEINKAVRANIFRIPGCSISGTDFDEWPGVGISFKHRNIAYQEAAYRRNTGMQIFHRFPNREKCFYFDGEWRQYVLRLSEGEFAGYTLYDIFEDSQLTVYGYCELDADLEAYQDKKLLGKFSWKAGSDSQLMCKMPLSDAEASVIRIVVESGVVDIEYLVTKSSDKVTKTDCDL